MKAPSFLAICLNPTLQKTLRFPSLLRDRVNRTTEHRLDASGKGVNVTRVLTQLGREAIHLTQLGGELRPLFLSLCAADKIQLRWAESGSQIRFCYTAIDAADKSVTELVEESEPVKPKTGDSVMALFEELIPNAGTLIISGSKAAGFSDDIIPQMTRIAKSRGLRVILDVRGTDLQRSLPYGPDIIKPNLSEFLSTYMEGEALEDEEELKARVAEIAMGIVREHGSQVVLTRGAHAVWLCDGKSFTELEIEAVIPVNTTGSGDAFTAGLASALSDGASLREAAMEGVRCGRINALLLRPGTIV